MERAGQFIHEWHENFLHQNTDFLDTILHDEVVFFSPVVFKGIHGKSMTKLYLTAAGESFNMEKFAYVREVHQGLHSVLEFETFIDDIAVNGVDIIEWDEKGKIVNFKVMVRPFKAIEKVREKMIESLEKISN